MTTSLFITLTVITILSVLAFYVFLCLYVYADASVNSDKPVRWLLISIFTPDMFGFLIYMLVGRNKNSHPVKKFRCPAIVSAIFSVVAIIIFISSVIFTRDIPVINNVSVGMVNNNIGSHWNVSYKSSGETLDRTISLNEEELENFIVEASCEEGELYLLMLQGKNVKAIDINGLSGERLRLDDFSAGKIKLTLYNESAKNAKIKIDW